MLSDLLANPEAYFPPKSSLWLWLGGPALIALVYFLTSRSTRERDRRLREANLWRDGVAAGQAGAEPRAADTRTPPEPPSAPLDAGPVRVAHLPAEFGFALRQVAEAIALRHYELVPAQAYLSFLEAGLLEGSDAQTVTLRLDEPAPPFEARPLPFVDGRRAPNTGLQFKKDPAFMALFQVSGGNPKAVGRWLSKPLREALCELPEAWLRVSGRTATVTLFGYADAVRIDRLVELADTVFAEHGAEGGQSLFGPESHPGAELATAVSPKRKANITTMSETPTSKKSKDVVAAKPKAKSKNKSKAAPA